MSLTPKEHPQWFLPSFSGREDFITVALAAGSAQSDWLNKLIEAINLDALKITYASNHDFYEDLKKNSQLLELLAAVGTSAGWLDRLLQRANDDIKQVVIAILKERLQKDLLKHIGPDSTHRQKQALINDLQVLYALLTDQCPAALKLTEAQCQLIQSQLLSGVANCTAGFHNRVQEIIQSLKKSTAPPESIAEILALIRDELVRRAANSFKEYFASQSPRNQQWLTSNEVHLYNQFTLIAAVEGYATQVTNHSDPFGLDPGHIPSMRQALSETFAERYTLFGNFIALQTYIKNALSLHDYRNKKPVGESYTSGECQKFTAYLNQLCGLSIAEDSPEYMLKDDNEYLIDIDWPALSRKLWQKMQQDGYFPLSDTHRKFFAFLQSTTSDKEKPEVEDLPKADSSIATQLFLSERDVMACVEAFGLNEQAQGKLLRDFVEPAVKKRQLLVDGIVVVALKSSYKNNIVELLWQYREDKDSGFYYWLPHFHSLVQSALLRYDYVLLEKLGEGVLKKSFLAWQQFRIVKPEELLWLIGGLTRHRDFTNWLIKHLKFSDKTAGYQDSNNNTLLNRAVLKDDVLAVKLLLMLGANIAKKNIAGHSPESLASNKPVIKMLLARYEVELALLEKLETRDLDEYDDLTLINKEDMGLINVAETLLMRAAKYGRVNAVKRLFAAGVPTELRDKWGKTALEIAIIAGQEQIVTLFLKNLDPAVLRNEEREADASNWLELAVQHGHVAIVKLFKREFGDGLFVEETMVCERGSRSLLMMAAAQGNLDMVETLLDCGDCAIDYEMDGQTALSLAAADGHLAIVEKLLAVGAEDYQFENEFSKYVTPALIAAADAGNSEIFKKLLSAAVYVPLTREKNISDVIEPDAEEREEFPEEYAALVREEFNKRAAIFAAIERGDPLVDVSGLPINCMMGSSKHVSLLTTAVKSNHLALVKTLLARGARFHDTLQYDLDKKNYAMLREFLLVIKDENRPEFFSGHFQSLINDAEGLAFVLKLCEEQPGCWYSLFDSLLYQAQFPPGTNRIANGDHSRQILINVASKDSRIAHAIFANKLHWLIYLRATDEDIPLSMFLAQTPEGQQVLKFLDQSDPLPLPMTDVSKEKPREQKKTATVVYRKKPRACKIVQPVTAAPVLADKPSQHFTIKKTMGDGNCAFHAVFGTDSELVLDADHLKHRQELAAAVLSTSAMTEPERYELIQACVLALLHEASINAGIFKDSPNLGRLLRSYQANAAAEAEAEHQFRQAVLANPQVAGFIEERCKDYIGPSGKKLSAFTDKYIHMKNNFKDEFELLLDAEGLLTQYTTYQAFSLRDFSGDISASHIEEYAKILGRPGQHLLAQEMNLLAQVFNKTITYYLGVEGGKTLPPVVFNAGCADVVAVRHNGVNHFERVEEGDKPQPRLDSKISRPGFFNVPSAVMSSAMSSAEPSRPAATKRKRDDSDVSGQGKQSKVDSSVLSGADKSGPR